MRLEYIDVTVQMTAAQWQEVIMDLQKARGLLLGHPSEEARDVAHSLDRFKERAIQDFNSDVEVATKRAMRRHLEDRGWQLTPMKHDAYGQPEEYWWTHPRKETKETLEEAYQHDRATEPKINPILED